MVSGGRNEPRAAAKSSASRVVAVTTTIGRAASGTGVIAAGLDAEVTALAEGRDEGSAGAICDGDLDQGAVESAEHGTNPVVEAEGLADCGHGHAVGGSLSLRRLARERPGGRTSVVQATDSDGRRRGHEGVRVHEAASPVEDFHFTRVWCELPVA